MVDNFKLIRDYIEKKIIGSGTWKEGDCFYVQLLRRQSDDPLIDGKKDKKYHGNMHSRSIKDYLIKSLQHLDDVEEDIKILVDYQVVFPAYHMNKKYWNQIDFRGSLSDDFICGLIKHSYNEVVNKMSRKFREANGISLL